GELKDPNMVTRRIALMEFITCAAPRYLETHGEPRTIEALERHTAVHYFASRTGQVFDWDFVVDGEPVAVKMKGVVAVNDGNAYVDCGLQGFGMLQVPRFMVLEHLRSGALVEVLPEWRPAPMPVSVVYLQNRHLSPKVRAFV